ncbi:MULTISPECIES: CHAD domain-containing protein [Aphanothece]|uniref:CHAD domain-containing protein n=1 Tax=Aphanothece TaxID=1121 RepID=UPI003984C490
MGGSTDGMAILSNGAHAHQLLDRHCKRMVSLHAPVLENRDPEPLHQMRVAMRRLRTCLNQFGPALELPDGVGVQRLARSVRRLGAARDLDVLRDRLEQTLLPRLPKQEIRRLKPALKQLQRERGEAQQQLQEVLNSSRHLKLIAQLQKWLRQPRYTPLGDEPLQHWLLEWQWPCLGTLLLHRGWRITAPQGQRDVEELHALRKGIKEARYRLENLQPLGGAVGLDWINRLKQGQELLGELNDLAVLRQAIESQASQRLARHLPELDKLLDEQRLACWAQWRILAMELVERHERAHLVLGLIGDRALGGQPDVSGDTTN